jgi:hypothetical protein
VTRAPGPEPVGVPEGDIVWGEADDARTVEPPLLCELRDSAAAAADNPGANMGSTTPPGCCFAAAVVYGYGLLRGGRGGGASTLSGDGATILGSDRVGTCRRGERTSDGRRIKLFTTSATENVGISGELRFLIRVCGGELEPCRSLVEGSCPGDEEQLFARERVWMCGLGLRARGGTDAGCNGGEVVPMIDENEERGV